jgi:hypothetical protein
MLLLAFLVMRVRWLWSTLERSPELVALLGGVVAVQMPRALLLQQVFEAARGLLRVLLRRALDSRDSVVWLALAVGTRVVVVVAIALVPIVAASVLDGEGVATEPLDRVLLRVVLGDSQRLEFLWEEEVTKLRREGGEAVVVARRRSLLAP